MDASEIVRQTLDPCEGASSVGDRDKIIMMVYIYVNSVKERKRQTVDYFLLHSFSSSE